MQKKKDKISFIQPSIQKGVRKFWRPLEDGTTEWWRDFRRFMHEPSCPGSAFLEPEKVKAGQLESLKLIFRVDKGGILPPGHRFKREKNKYISSKVRLSTPGVHTIAVIDERRGITGPSNPVLIDEGRYGPYNLFFGDIHGHNVYCDGRGTADEYYGWGRDVRFLDFSALTNYVEGAKRFPVKDFWNLVKAKAAEYNDPGQFVTFLAFEWGSWDVFGDKCVYYLSNEGDYFPANEERSNTPEKFWNLLRGKGALTIAHHAKYGGKTDWTFHDNELQPLVEIYSIWGSSESGGEHSAQKAWEKGYMFRSGSEL